MGIESQINVNIQVNQSGTLLVGTLNTQAIYGIHLKSDVAQGKMRNRLLDVHGTGSQRSDPKFGSASNYPQYFGLQGGLRYVFNYVRCVRTAN